MRQRWMIAMVSSWLAGSALAASLEGQLVLYADGRALRAEEASDAVIYFRPRQPAALPAAREQAVMLTRRKQFQPRLLPIMVGSSVRFPNEDPILHNVFSTSPDNAFDAGLYGTGPGVVHRFASPGLVKVYCNVHHSMFGFILVLDTPHFTRADATGAFRLSDVPAGEGDLVVFHDRAQPWRRRIDPAGAAPLQIRVDLDKRRVPPHMNKFGRPYGGTPNERRY
jgi:plastocyanin